jgi:predicted nucleic acid-binding protein
MICIDTNILIWGLDQKCSEGLEHMIVLATRFFRHVTDDRIQIMIPSQVLAEFLVRNTEAEREEALNKLSDSFSIEPLDAAAAIVAAEISSNVSHCKELRKTFGVTRNCQKADINVLATAINGKATKLVTGDSKEMRALAKGKILVKSLQDYMDELNAEPAEPVNVPTAPPRASTGQKSLSFGDENEAI